MASVQKPTTTTKGTGTENVRSNGHITVDVPIADAEFPVVSHVALQFDRGRHKRYLETLRQVGAGLRRDKKRLANDMPIRSVRDVVRWLIEQAGNHPPEIS